MGSKRKSTISLPNLRCFSLPTFQQRYPHHHGETQLTIGTDIVCRFAGASVTFVLESIGDKTMHISYCNRTLIFF